MMKSYYSSKLKLIPSAKNICFLNRQMFLSSIVRNHFIALLKRHYNIFCNNSSYQYPGIFTINKHYTKIRNKPAYVKAQNKTYCEEYKTLHDGFFPLYAGWGELYSTTARRVLTELDLSYQAFFKWAKTKSGPKRLPPQFKKSKNACSVFFLGRDIFLNEKNNSVYIKGQKIKYFDNNMPIRGTIKTGRIIKDNCNDYWLSLSIEHEKEEIKTKDNIALREIGIACPTTTFLLLSNGQKIEHPLFLLEEKEKQAKLSKNLSKKEKGSKNRERARLELARLHRKIYRKRKEFHLQTAHMLTSNYDTIYIKTKKAIIEKNNKNIPTKYRKNINRKASDLAYANFLLTLKNIAEKKGVEIYEIGTKDLVKCFACKKKIDFKNQFFINCPHCSQDFFEDRKNEALLILYNGQIARKKAEKKKKALAVKS